MEKSTMRSRHASATVVFVFAMAAVMLADPPTLSIEPQATLVGGGIGVTVRANVNCGDGESIAVLLVGVRQGEFAMETVVEFESTGNRQEVSVTIPGPYSAGDAIASAQLACAALFTGEVLGATIRISE
jgi:hypothetical protein